MGLSDTKNAMFMPILKTAHEHHVAPTVYLQPRGRYNRSTIEWDDWGRQWVPRPVPDSERTALDVALEVGYQFYTDSQCGNCGVPFWYGYSANLDINFEVEGMVCHSCAAMEREKEKRPEGPGERYRTKPTGFHYENTGLTIPLPSPQEALAWVQ